MSKIYCVDFDGTLCKDAWPEIGEMNIALIEKLKKLQKDGHRIILWTCREGNELTPAVNACKELGLIFDAVNDNLPDMVEQFNGNDCRKVYADYYIDDKNLLIWDSSLK